MPYNVQLLNMKYEKLRNCQEAYGLIKKKNSFQKRLLYNEQKCPNHGNYMHIQQRDQTNRFMKTKKDAAAMKFR